MDKTYNFNKDELTKQIENDLKKFFDAAKEAKTLHYKSLIGTEYEEKPGTYNNYMVRAMARDMLTFWLYVKNKDPEIGKIVESWMPKMSTRNTEMMRMIDDYRGDRPLKPFFRGKKTEKFMDEIAKVTRSGVIKDCPITDIKERLKVWISRLVYQLAWAYVLEQKREMRDQLMEAEMKEIDADGNILSGLSEDDENAVKALITIQKILLELFLKIPVTDPKHQKICDTLEWLHVLTEAIIQGKMDEFVDILEEKLYRNDKSGLIQHISFGTTNTKIQEIFCFGF